MVFKKYSTTITSFDIEILKLTKKITFSGKLSTQKKLKELAEELTEQKGKEVIQKEICESILSDYLRKQGIKNIKDLAIKCPSYKNFLLEFDLELKKATQGNLSKILEPGIIKRCEKYEI